MRIQIHALFYLLLSAPWLVCGNDTPSSQLRGSSGDKEHRQLMEEWDAYDRVASARSHSVLDEAAFPWCGEHLSGFQLVRSNSYSDELETIETLSNDATVAYTDFAHLSLVAMTDVSVGVVRYYLPHAEENSFTAPFVIDAEWLSQYDGQVVTIRADAFEAGYERFLGTCELHIRVQVGHALECHGGLAGFYLTDEFGRKNEAVGNLKQGHVIPLTAFSAGTEVAVSTDVTTTIASVSFAAPESRSHILVETPPFRVNAGISAPGAYHILARAFADEASTDILNECEITFHVVDQLSAFQQQQQRMASSANTWIGQASYADDPPDAQGHRRLGR